MIVPYFLLAICAFGIWLTLQAGFLALTLYLLALVAIKFVAKVALYKSDMESSSNDSKSTK